MRSKKVLFFVPLAMFCLIPFLPAADESTAADEDTLKKAAVALNDADLIAYLRKQTLSDKDRKQIETLIEQLGDTRLEARDTAADQLTTIGVPALPFLREAQRSSHRELSHRAEPVSERDQRRPRSRRDRCRRAQPGPPPSRGDRGCSAGVLPLCR